MGKGTYTGGTSTKSGLARRSGGAQSSPSQTKTHVSKGETPQNWTKAVSKKVGLGSHSPRNP